MNHTGFVYLWRDRYRKMNYIGSHIGSLNDGYTGSSQRFKRAIKKRPKDFRRKILMYFNDCNRKQLLKEEERWLQMIKPDRLQKNFYNVKRTGSGGFVTEGYSASQRCRYRKKLKLRPGRGKNHYKSKSCYCDGKIFLTLTDAKKFLGWDPIRKIKSRKDENFYYVSDGKPSQDEILRNKAIETKNKKRSIDAMKIVNLTLSKEYHKQRTKKSGLSRKGKKWKKDSSMRMGRTITVDGVSFNNLKHAAKVTGLTYSQIKKLK